MTKLLHKYWKTAAMAARLRCSAEQAPMERARAASTQPVVRLSTVRFLSRFLVTRLRLVTHCLILAVA